MASKRRRAPAGKRAEGRFAGRRRARPGGRSSAPRSPPARRRQGGEHPPGAGETRRCAKPPARGAAMCITTERTCINMAKPPARGAAMRFCEISEALKKPVPPPARPRLRGPAFCARCATVCPCSSGRCRAPRPRGRDCAALPFARAAPPFVPVPPVVAVPPAREAAIARPCLLHALRHRLSLFLRSSPCPRPRGRDCAALPLARHTGVWPLRPRAPATNPLMESAEVSPVPRAAPQRKS